MDLDALRESVLRERAALQMKKARRATWDVTAGRKELKSTTMDAHSPDNRAKVASPAVSRSISSRPSSTGARERLMTPRPPSSHSECGTQPSTPALSYSYSTSKRQFTSTMDKRKTFASAGSLKNPLRLANVRRWDPRTRSTQPWDGLRRDFELFHPTGDLLVHLYAKGHSRRGPSFSVQLKKINEMRCGRMFTLCFADETPDSVAQKTLDSSKAYEIFIPAPDHAMREEAFAWHITTRNFFAFVFGKPLVGAHLGKALVDLQRRLQMFRSEEVHNYDDMVSYLEKIGYLNFDHNVDHALAILYFAEHYKYHDLWIDAFAHCVGMNDKLDESSEFEHISRTTKALITRAFLEMDLHLSRVSRSLSNFLDEELSSSNLGLTRGARAHLDRFRSFLHQYYVEKWGYWPLPKGSQLPKPLYKSMYFDFRALYDYLVDTDSHGSMSERLPSGGICVLQNLQAFDDRHKYSPLPHPLPLLPNASAHAKAQSQRVFLARLGSKNARNDRQSTARSALHAATNTKDLSNVNAPLVKAYRQFEREECAARKEEKCSLGDARKTRWILVYTTFQMLISVNRAPKEVRATEHATYPLCVMVAGLPPWDVQVPPPGLNTPASPVEDRPTTAIAVNSGASIDQNGMPNLHKALPKPPALEIHPDCENDAEYLSGSRNNSSSSLTNLTTINEPQTPPKTTLPSPIRRNSSKRSVKGLSFSSLVSRRNSVVEKPQQPSFCEIIIHGYGNGLNPIIVDKSASDDQPQPMEEFIGLGPPKANPVESDTTPTPVFARSNSCFTITTVNATDRHPSLPSQAQRPRVRSKKKPEQLTNLHVKAAPDPIRTPTLDIEQIDTMKDMIPDSEDMSMSTITGTDSDTDDVSPVWSSRRGSASSQSSADNEDKAMEVGLLDEHDDVSKLMTQSTPELIDVGGLLKGSNPAGKRPQGILVHRSFSVERFNAPLAGTGGNVIPPNVLAARKERDKAFAAAQGKWKRKSVRYKEQVDMITALDTGPVGAAP